MNKKKCPKCGEENPPEAVMCWACYTPLSGAAAAPAGAAPGKSTPNLDGEGAEKQKIPPWQLGVIGLALVVGLFFGVRTLMPADEGYDDADVAFIEPTDPGGGAPPPPAPAAPSPTVGGGGGEGGGAIAPAKAPFTIVAPPNPRLSVATMAIMPTDENISGPQAAALAAYTRRQYTSQVKTWNAMYIYVFSDANSAKYFSDFMRKRRGAALTTSDYSNLVNLWRSVLARYEYRNVGGKGVERVTYPSNNPSGWWYERSNA